jgi:hypothetical protein
MRLLLLQSLLNRPSNASSSVLRHRVSLLILFALTRTRFTHTRVVS